VQCDVTRTASPWTAPSDVDEHRVQSMCCVHAALPRPFPHADDRGEFEKVIDANLNRGVSGWPSGLAQHAESVRPDDFLGWAAGTWGIGNQAISGLRSRVDRHCPSIARELSKAASNRNVLAPATSTTK